MVDTTFVRTRKPCFRSYYYYNKNKNDYGLLYQITCSFSKPFRILDFSGPFKGSSSDVGIIRSTIIPRLNEGEKFLCDKGYVNEPLCITAPKGKFSSLTFEQKGVYIDIARIRQINERVIGRVVEWGLMKKRWNLSFDLHELCAKGIAKLTQIMLYTNKLT